jgi:hypothetical protein
VAHDTHDTRHNTHTTHTHHETHDNKTNLEDFEAKDVEDADDGGLLAGERGGEGLVDLGHDPVEHGAVHGLAQGVPVVLGLLDGERDRIGAGAARALELARRQGLLEQILRRDVKRISHRSSHLWHACDHDTTRPTT